MNWRDWIPSQGAIFSVLFVVGLGAICVVGVRVLTSRFPLKYRNYVGGGITVVFIAILAAIAIPSYEDYTIRGRHPVPVERALPVWNAWIEDSSTKTPTFLPVSRTIPGARASLVVELATLSYSIGRSSITSETLTDDQLAEIEKEGATPTIAVLAVPAAKFFWPLPNQERVQKVRISLAELRKALADDGSTKTSDPLSYLRKAHGKAPFSIARLVFNLRTREVAQPGVASVALFFWVEDGAKGALPIGSLAVSLCVTPDSTSSCPKEAVKASTFEGPLQIRVAQELGKTGGYPDAALTIAQLDSQSAVGVFYCGRCSGDAGQFVTWDIGMSTNDLAKQLRDQSLADLESADTYADPEAFRRAGVSMFNLLFGADLDARNSFSSWVSELSVAVQDRDRRPQTLFVRLLQPVGEERFVVPLNLLAVPLAGRGPVFLGSLVEVQAPLENEDYSSGEHCLDQWALFVPPADIESQDSALGTTRLSVADWIDTIKRANAGRNIFDDVASFDTWISNPELTPPTALVTLSHHDSSKLFFNSNTMSPVVPAANLLRQFSAPSLAVVDACGVAKPGAFEVIRKLNVTGNIGTIVASTTLVDKTLGGEFLARFLDQVASNQDPRGVTVGDAVFLAERSLGDARRSGEHDGPRATYGPSALLFGVLGNSNLRVCSKTPATQQISP